MNFESFFISNQAKMRKLAVISLTNTRIFLQATLFLTHRCFLTFHELNLKCCLSVAYYIKT